MYIAPNTNIRLLQNCPIESGYNHTLWFDSLNSQTTYFIGLTKYNLSDYSYQRHTDASIKVGIRAENLYNCNYLMFQNETFGSKWFYAFIRDVEYISNDVSLVTYELDYIQSYLFDFSMGQCFVEREHSTTDNVGDNILPEPVMLGEYFFKGYDVLSPQLGQISTIIAYVDIENNTSNGKRYDNVFSGVAYKAFNSDDVSGINDFLSEYVQSPDSIVLMFTCPFIALHVDSIPKGGIDVPQSSGGWAQTVVLDSIVPGTDDLDGYVPKNNKLYTYPYNYLHLDNANGSVLSLRYEFFNGSPRIALNTNICPPVKVVARPLNYKGLGSGITENIYLHTETLALENYPMCSWNMDSYKVWLAQNTVPMMVKGATGVITTANSMLGSILGAGASVGSAFLGGSKNMAGNMLSAGSSVAGGAINAANSMINLVAAMYTDSYTASIQADQVRGSVNNGNNNVSGKFQNIYCGRCTITAEYAKVIDNFFSAFGYATKTIKVPNRNSRPQWNYVKTAGCIINGSIPADAERAICDIHDRGITYWKNPANYGNYSLDNSPT